MTSNAPNALHDALLDDPDDHWLETVLKGLKGRSGEAKQALIEALVDGRDVSTLLGLELSTTENKEENPAQIKDSNLKTALSPLLGTISVFSDENGHFAEGKQDKDGHPRAALGRKW